MKTFLPKKEAVNQKWYVVDAKDQVLGKVATKVASRLRGKDKAVFTPHMDCGEHVIVINCDQIKLTGKKMSDKIYARHSGFPGGYKEENAANLIGRKPTKVLELAVYGMLPRNRLRKVFMQKLRLYAGAEHPHEAQQPENLAV